VGPLLDAILGDVTRFAGRRPQADDITVLAVRIA
jgi:serine phosphatase RsbU (regulator of sigma subunit)